MAERDVPEFKVKVSGNGTQEPPYRWDLFRRNSSRGINDYYNSTCGTGSCETRAEAYQQAAAKALEIKAATDSWKVSEEYQFDVDLDPELTRAPVEPELDLHDLPVAEPNRTILEEKSND